MAAPARTLLACSAFASSALLSAACGLVSGYDSLMVHEGGPPTADGQTYEPTVEAAAETSDDAPATEAPFDSSVDDGALLDVTDVTDATSDVVDAHEPACLDEPVDPCGRGPTLVSNGSFEFELTSWGTYKPSPTNVVEAVAEPSPDGVRHARIAGGASAHLAQGLASVVPAGKKVCITFCYKTEGSNGELLAGVEKDNVDEGFPKDLVTMPSSNAWRFGKYERFIPASFANHAVGAIFVAKTGAVRVDRVEVRVR
jgi:hypothetical protein